MAPPTTRTMSGVRFLFLLISLSAICAHSVTIPSITSWSDLPKYPFPTFEAGGGVLGNSAHPHRLLVCGGFTRFPNVTRECYTHLVTPPTNADTRWTRVADLPRPLTHLAHAVRGNRIYTAGGFLGAHPGKSVNDVYVYSIKYNKWNALPPLPANRAGGGLVLRLNRSAGVRELIYAGGTDRVTNAVLPAFDHGTTWSLDLRKREKGWVRKAAIMPDPRNHQGSAKSCGRFFWVGGQHLRDEHGGNRVTANEYVPSADVWRSIASLPKPLGHISASTLPYRCGVLVVGGVTNGRIQSKDVFFWHPSVDKWFKIGEMPIALATPVCGINDDTLVCATGAGVQKDRAFAAKLELKSAPNV